MTPAMSGTVSLSVSKSWTCQDFMSPYCDRICSHCGAAVLMSMMNVDTSLFRSTTVPPSSGNGPRCTKSGSKSFAVSLLIYTPPYHALGCAARCFPILRIDRFDRGFRVTTNHRYFTSLRTRVKREELDFTKFHTVLNQASIIADGSFTWFSDKHDRASNNSFHKETHSISPDKLLI